jgi:hypothetical protein
MEGLPGEMQAWEPPLGTSTDSDDGVLLLTLDAGAGRLRLARFAHRLFRGPPAAARRRRHWRTVRRLAALADRAPAGGTGGPCAVVSILPESPCGARAGGAAAARPPRSAGADPRLPAVYRLRRGGGSEQAGGRPEPDWASTPLEPGHLGR